VTTILSRIGANRVPADIALNPIDTGDGLFVIAAVRDRTDSNDRTDSSRVSDLQLLGPGSSAHSADPDAG